ncbi:hypothetical protein [Gordonia sp. NB41Y]|nr:hypothetical protein [Gordonia sp. NB41Y]EMP10033.1 hypothetical protein ISGA_1476 [Gordonia sp. NB41Y]WLP90225.1 hypothetical protein Q9K23_22370 [Gordonia sp. NB41Y]
MIDTIVNNLGACVIAGAGILVGVGLIVDVIRAWCWRDADDTFLEIDRGEINADNPLNVLPRRDQ